MDAEPTPAPSAGMWRVWATLLAAPLVLALAFAPVLAYFVLVRGLEGDGLYRAVEAAAPLPASLGFLCILLLTLRMAKADGLSPGAMGWRWLGTGDLMLGVGFGAVVSVANAVWFYPIVQRAQPTFDPTLQQTPLGLAIVMLGFAVVAEESLYRGYAFVRLTARLGKGVAIGVTSIWYAAMTPGPDLALKVWALGFGVSLAAFRVWRPSLWPVIVAHATVSLSPKVIFTMFQGPSP